MGGWEEAHPGQVTQTDQRGISDHVTSCSVYKAGGKKEETFGVAALVFPSCYSMGWGPAPLEVLNICLPMGSRELILFFFACVCGFWFPY